ncbi:RNA polymerase sigma-70 factor (ECF subfamily) [Chitinophaga skermanii]|uniref:RNA polymerase sigma-70 factor (ECF subfamily) n=1 Tax=Chitinophaga skermanii TaxID=331697 RepID=A0A327QIA9_9BACT|nr:RNA polymerase sigma-70 factor [Chitinophaga skermanii]RAJ04041.1 RNA polymerase sigma-70 factor (ECF subfamily) [Chitinophaga skermanii]
MNQDVYNCIAQVKEGSTTAFYQLFNTWKDPLFGYALKLCRTRDMAEEAVQEVFMRIWMHREKLDPSQNIQAYLYTAIRNSVFNSLKKAAIERRLKSGVSYHQSDTDNTTEEKISAADLHRAKDQAISQLPPQRKLIFQLSRMEGLSQQQIALKLGISTNTVKDQIVKANRFLRTQLKY